MMREIHEDRDEVAIALSSNEVEARYEGEEGRGFLFLL